MKNFQILRYLKKFIPVITAFCLIATYAIYYKLSSSNTYVASEVIHYNDEKAEEGLTPTGDKLDVNEIKSSAVISKVVDKMGLTGIYSVDSLISRIDITPVEDKDKVARKEAMLEEGEEYVYEPSTFIVSFRAASYEGEDFARTILDETLDTYFSIYSQKYVNVAPVGNTIESLNKGNYDYIEMMELIDNSIEETVNALYKRIEQNSYYRATCNGASFADLVDDFNYLRQSKVSSLFSMIYKYQITKNRPVLISDYTTRIDNNNISNTKELSIVEDVVKVIDAYVTKMRESGNTNITYEYILDDLHEKNLEEIAGDQTVTYDELIYSWRDHNESREHAVIDTAYCRYVIDVFSGCTGACGGACASSDKTCTQLCNANYDNIRAQIDAQIDTLIEGLNQLYTTTMATNEEYNEYLGASYISVLSSASVKESVNVVLYTIIAFFFLMVLLCGGAVVLGRAGDIVSYVFYTDHLTGIGNRVYFDRYLKTRDKKFLDDGAVYCVVDIANLVEINKHYTRSAGDDIIKLFTLYIKESFGKTKAEFIYNGNGSFVIVAENSDYITVEDIMSLFMLRLDEREEHKNVCIEYKIGIAETFRERKTARKLLSEAIKNKKSYTSQAR